MKRDVSLLRRVFNSELIEIVIPANATKFKIQFPDQQNIRYAKLMGLEIFTEEVVPVSILTGNPLANQILLSFVSVTLQAYQGENFMWQKPAPRLINLGTATVFQNYSPDVFTRQRVDWPKSYIEIAAGAPLPVVPTVIQFEVNYIDALTKEKRRKEATFKNRS